MTSYPLNPSHPGGMFADTRVLITAGASGIGLHTVQSLFERAAAHLGGLDVLVNNAGIAGSTAPLEDIDFSARLSPYASAKWAIRGLTRTLAQELGPFRVRVNCICPGSVEGERMDRVIAAEAAKTGTTEEHVRKLFVDAASLKQFVRADDIANAILSLCGEAGRMVSGQDFVVDGHTETL